MDETGYRRIDKRSKIIDKTIKLLIDNDFRKVTMDDIARLSNVSKMTVYKYFYDKESLYKYVCEAVIEKCMNDLKKHFVSDLDITQKMIMFTSVLIDFITKGYLLLCNRLAAFNDDINNDLKRFNEENKKMIIDMIIEGKKKRLLKEDIGNESIYYYIDMGLSYFQYSRDYREKMISESVFRKEFMSFIWSNIFTDRSQFTC